MKVPVAVSLDAGSPRADRNLLFALSNLVDNAIQAMPGDGEVTLSTKHRNARPAVRTSRVDEETGGGHDCLRHCHPHRHARLASLHPEGLGLLPGYVSTSLGARYGTFFVGGKHLRGHVGGLRSSGLR